MSSSVHATVSTLDLQTPYHLIMITCIVVFITVEIQSPGCNWKFYIAVRYCIKIKKITLCCLVQSVFPFSHLSFSGPVASWWLTCCRPALNLRRPSPPYKQATLWPPSVGLPLDFLEILQFYGQVDNGSRRPGAVLSQGVHSIH